MVQRDRRAAIALIRDLPFDNSQANLSTLRGSPAQDCAAGASGASALLVRGAIAQAMFQRDFRGAFGGEPRTGVQPVNMQLPIEAAPGGVETYRWADCVVRNEPIGTEQLLRSYIGSGEEAAAISRLQPYMSACMADGAQLTVRLIDLRSLFAQGAYNGSYRYWTGQLRVTR
jgi:hypothetical protein